MAPDFTANSRQGDEPTHVHLKISAEGERELRINGQPVAVGTLAGTPAEQTARRVGQMYARFDVNRAGPGICPGCGKPSTIMGEKRTWHYNCAIVAADTAADRIAEEREVAQQALGQRDELIAIARRAEYELEDARAELAPLGYSSTAFLVGTTIRMLGSKLRQAQHERDQAKADLEHQREENSRLQEQLRQVDMALVAEATKPNLAGYFRGLLEQIAQYAPFPGVDYQEMVTAVADMRLQIDAAGEKLDLVRIPRRDQDVGIVLRLHERIARLIVCLDDARHSPTLEMGHEESRLAKDLEEERAKVATARDAIELMHAERQEMGTKLTQSLEREAALRTACAELKENLARASRGFDDASTQLHREAQARERAEEQRDRLKQAAETYKEWLQDTIRRLNAAGVPNYSEEDPHFKECKSALEHRVVTLIKERDALKQQLEHEGKEGYWRATAYRERLNRFYQLLPDWPIDDDALEAGIKKLRQELVESADILAQTGIPREGNLPQRIGRLQEALQGHTTALDEYRRLVALYIKTLDDADIPWSEGATCSHEQCESEVQHRIKTLVEQRNALQQASVAAAEQYVADLGEARLFRETVIWTHELLDEHHIPKSISLRRRIEGLLEAWEAAKKRIDQLRELPAPASVIDHLGRHHLRVGDIVMVQEGDDCWDPQLPALVWNRELLKVAAEKINAGWEAALL